MRLYDFFLRGGPLMWPLLVLSIAAVAIALERALVLWREPGEAEPLVEALADETTDWVALAEATGGCAAALAAGARQAAETAPEQLEAIVDGVGHEVLGRLEAPLNALRAIAEVAPLLGFLGTVIGMIGAFDSIVAEGVTSPKIVAAGISTALLTTAGGLAVGIPAYLLHSLLTSRLDRVAAALARIAHALARRAAGETR